MRPNHRTLLRTLIGGSALLLAACGQSDPGNAPNDVLVAATTELGVVTQGVDLLGRDGGYSGEHNGRTVWVFGDTQARTDTGDVRWLSNSAATSPVVGDANGPEQIDSLRDSAGQPAPLLAYTEPEQQYINAHSGPDCESPCGARWALWPGALVRDEARGRSLLFYQRVHAAPGEFNFYGVGRSLAVWPDGATTPQRVQAEASEQFPTLLWPADESGPGAAAMVEDGYIYAFACFRDDIDWPCQLARSRLNEATDRSAWRFADTNGQWGSNRQGTDTLFLGNDIMSLAFNTYLGRYIVVYSQPLSRTIVMRSAPALTGPWSKEFVVAAALPSTNGNGAVYDAIMHPQYSDNNGQSVLVTYTRQPASGPRELRALRVELERTGLPAGRTQSSGPGTSSTRGTTSLAATMPPLETAQ
jgi:hypothetical protein